MGDVLHRAFFAFVIVTSPYTCDLSRGHLGPTSVGDLPTQRQRGPRSSWSLKLCVLRGRTPWDLSFLCHAPLSIYNG